MSAQEPIRLAASPAQNATALRDLEVRAPGFVSFVSVSVHAGAPGNAGAYARVTRRRGTGGKVIVTLLWEGPVAVGGEAPSMPAVPVDRGDVLRLEAAAANGVTGLTIVATVDVDDVQGGLCVIHSERPGVRPGDVVALASGNPAAGQPISLVVSAQNIWDLIGGSFALATSADVADRRVFLQMSGQIAAASERVEQALSSVTYYIGRWGGGTDAIGPLVWGLPLRERSQRTGPGGAIVVNAVNLQAADDFTALNAVVERWATL